MSGEPSVASVPPVDRALGAVVTFAAGSFVGYVLALVLAPAPTDATGVVPAVAGVAVGLVAAVVLVFAGGYQRLLVPVEGRRWAVELGVAFLVVAGVFALDSVVPAVPDLLAVLVAALGVLGTRRVGEAVADARDWYDRDDYYRDD